MSVQHAPLVSAEAAFVAGSAVRSVSLIVRNAGYAAARALSRRNAQQFTGGHYFCPGPLPGVPCKNVFGKRHFSPSYKGTNWRCPHCRKRKFKFSAIIESKPVPSKLSVNSPIWEPKR